MSCEARKLDPVVFDVIYGPLKSRRFGLSLGVNPLDKTMKICSYDCGYCSLGPTQVRINQIKKEYHFASPEDIANQLRSALIQSHSQNLNSILLSGNGEPTLYPHFHELCTQLVLARNEMAPDAHLTCLTNGAHLDNKKVISGLNELDSQCVKIDAGNDRLLKLVNSPLTRTTVSKNMLHARKLSALTVQSLFIKGAVDNTGDDAINEWMEVVGMLSPKKVHIYSLEGQPHKSGLIAADEDTLHTIASKLKRKTDAEIKVF